MKKPLLLLGSIAGLIVAVSLLKTNPRREIYRVLEKTTKYAIFDSENSTQHPIEILSLAKDLSKSFTDPCVFTFLFPSKEKTFTLSRQEIIERYVALRRALGQLATTTKNTSIEMANDQATLTVQVTAMGREPERDDYFLEKHDVEINFKRIDGKWLISSARNLDPIEEPA